MPTHYHSSATGRRIIALTCEKCGTHFQYELIRSARSDATAPFQFVNESGLQDRANWNAVKELEKTLSNDAELVSCPKCNWVNEELVRKYRWGRYRFMRPYTILAMCAAVLFSWVVAMGARGMDLSEFERGKIGIVRGMLLAAGIATIGFGTQFLLRRRINPNANFPNPPKVPPGTPRGWTDEQMNQAMNEMADSEGKYVPMPDESAEDFPGWVVFRSSHLKLPEVCCECLGKVDQKVRILFVQSGTYPLPLCTECGMRLRASRLLWRLVFSPAAIAFLGVVFVYGKLFRLNYFVLGLAFLMFSVAVLGIFVIGIPNLIIAPFRLKTVNRARHVYRIRFLNEQYNEMVRRASMQSETLLVRTWQNSSIFSHFPADK